MRQQDSIKSLCGSVKPSPAALSARRIYMGSSPLLFIKKKREAKVSLFLV